MQQKQKVVGRNYTLFERAVCLLTAVIMACTMVALPKGLFAGEAYAVDSQIPEPTGAMSTDGYVTSDAWRAATPAPEMLGLSNTSYDSQVNWTSGSVSWTSPYSYIMGTGLNESPSPRIFNTISNALWDKNYSPILLDGRSGDVAARNGGPFASLNDYNNEVAKAIWNAKPDVIVGNSNGVDYNNADGYVTSVGDSSYKTYGYWVEDDGSVSNDKGVKYDSTNIYTMIDTTYNIAKAGNLAAESTGKSLRYGDPIDIATKYEKYVRGMQGYVLAQLVLSGKTEVEKKVALISDYDSSTGTYTLTKTGVAEGTATANRYLEATQNVANNIADSIEGDTATVTATELADCDLIMIGGQGKGAASTSDILASMSQEMQNKCYYADGSCGSLYGVVMNSTENAQNIGRILPMLYPEYLDQSDMIAYFYKNFYHIKDESLGYTIANAMDGVRNANNTGDSATQWSESDVADYDNAATDALLTKGAKYIKDYESLAPAKYANLKLTDTLKEALDEEATDVASATQSNALTYNGKEQTAEFTLVGCEVVDATQLKGTDAGTYDVELKLADGYVWEDGTTDNKTVQFTISPMDIAAAQINDPGDQFYTGKAITPISDSTKTGSGVGRIYEGEDYSVTYTSNTDKGTATATVTGMGNFTGTTTINFKIVEYSLTMAITDSAGVTKTVTMSRDDLDALALVSEDNEELTIAQYNKGSLIAVAAKGYVTFDALAESAGFDSWSSVTATASDGFNYTYDNTYDGYYFGGQTADDLTNTDNKVAVKAGLALQWQGGEVTTENTYTTAVALVSDKDNLELSPRLIMGVSEEDYVAGNYAGRRLVSNVNQLALTGTKATLVEASATQSNTLTYNGKEQTAEFTLVGCEVVDATQLKGTDAGTYDVEVKLQDGYVWKDGTAANKTVQFTISAMDIAAAQINDPGDQFYTGEAITPISGSTKTGSGVGRIYEGEDYSVVYANNTNKGTATATVTGMGNFTGTTTISFKIVEYSLSLTIIDNKGQQSKITLTRADLEQLAKDSNDNKDLTIAQYNSGKLIAAPAKGYVTIDALAAKGGLDTWSTVAVTAPDGFSYTYDNSYKGYYFGGQTATEAGLVNTEDKVVVKPALVLQWASGSVTESENAYNTAKSLVKSTDSLESAPRFIMGVSEEDYKAGNYGGNRLVSNVNQVSVSAPENAVYRLYNPLTSEHLFTTDLSEYNDLVNHNWNQEKVSWASATKDTGKAVYRLYNAGLGAQGKMSHIYTTDASEVKNLTENWGWTLDNNGNPMFYSAEDSTGKALDGAGKVYRMYNEGLSAHHFTMDRTEFENLTTNEGWNDEKTAFYAYAL